MPSFPNLNFSPDDIKIRYLEPYASEALDRRFLGTPLGVYEGFEPTFVGSLVTLGTSPRGFSLLRALSGLTKTSLDIVLDVDISFDFTGHDFDASGDIYLVANVSYVRGGTTTAQIVTQTAAPIGNTEIGICRVTGTGVGTILTLEFATTPDRYTNTANITNSYGYMESGSQEALANLVEKLGQLPYNPTVKTVSTTLTPADINQVHMFDMGSIVLLQTIDLPDASTLEDGAQVGFLSLSGLPVAASLAIGPVGTDLLMFGGSPVAFPIARIRKHVGHFFVYTLVKAATSGFPTARWYLTVNTLQLLHAADHQDGGADPIALDTLAAATDNTNLDASITAHGLLPKLSNNANEFINGVGAWAIPGGAVTGGPVYVFNTPALSGSNHVLPGDGTVSILNPPGGSGITTYALPPGTDPIGSICRVVFLADAPAPASLNHARFASTSGVFIWNGVQVLGTVPPNPGLVSDWRRGQFLEFTLQNFTGGNLWVCTANQQLADHSSRHAAGEEDELDITSLGGFPGGTTTFLREDGTFAGFAPTHYSGDASATVGSYHVLNVGFIGPDPLPGEILSNLSVAGTATVRNYYADQGIVTLTVTAGSFNAGNSISFSGGATGTALNTAQVTGSLAVFGTGVDAAPGISLNVTDAALILDNAGVYSIIFSGQHGSSNSEIYIYYDMLDFTKKKKKVWNAGVVPWAVGNVVHTVIETTGPALLFFRFANGSGSFVVNDESHVSVHRIS